MAPQPPLPFEHDDETQKLFKQAMDAMKQTCDAGLQHAKRSSEAIRCLEEEAKRPDSKAFSRTMRRAKPA